MQGNTSRRTNAGGGGGDGGDGGGGYTKRYLCRFFM